jgi:hypothetical protein
MSIPNPTDFPPGTQFLVTEFGVPLSVSPSGITTMWYNGRANRWYDYFESSQPKNEAPKDITYEEFIAIIEKSVEYEKVAWATIFALKDPEEVQAAIKAKMAMAMEQGKIPHIDRGDFLYARPGPDGLPDPEAD